ncbi:MarR family transcriptional regulator [Candidatus Woesearchaeota archaeon]|nr:MarR family transcriptional regulator [Candidatus Woesearchaeota archaeon]
MLKEDVLLKLEGLHTVETVAKTLNLTHQSALNLLSKLKKQGHVTTSGGGKKKRLYKITARKQRPREKGMFDIINKYSPMKLNPWYDHQVHGVYGPEEALIDAIQTKSFRVILASLRLFNHITNWAKLYKLAKEKSCWQKVGALYDLARMHFKVRRMPKKYTKTTSRKKHYLIGDYPTKEEKYINISKKWNVELPFRKGDLRKVEA